MGRRSDTFVEGWNPGFWDGVDEDGNRVGGFAWFEPDPPPPFPRQEARRKHRIANYISIRDAGVAAGISSVEVSDWERGRIELTAEQIAAYDRAIGYTEEL